MDAFPKNDKIIHFLTQFATKHEGEWIATRATTYLARVESGVKTTGWEID